MRKFIWKTQYNRPYNIKDIMKYIIQQKKLDPHTIVDYINGNVKTHDNFLLNNLEKAIIDICDNAHNILVVNDADPDGITSGCIMYLGLKSLADKFSWIVNYSIAERQNGYGLSKKIVDQAILKSVDYIITTDNGITSNDVIKYAQNNNITVIVTDHHQPGKELPNCLIIDPQIDNYPFKYICGALIAFKFIESLYQYLNLTVDSDLYNEFLSFATIGTVADVMKLTDENRYYVSKGLEYLNKTKNIGLKALIQQAKLGTITAETIAFQIGPMLNAANRLGKPAYAMNLLLTDDKPTAEYLAKELVSLNQSRKKMQKEVADNIPPEVLKDNFIILYKPDISSGICGSIASSISDIYKKPCFVLTGKKQLMGSGRSAKGYSILEFIKSIPDIVNGGGHSAAAGISLDENNLDELRKRANAHFNHWLIENDKDIEEYLYIVCEMNFDLINMRLANNLEALAPFGNGNPRPVFMTSKVNINSASYIGSENNVLKLELEKDNFTFPAIAFADVINQYNENMTTVDIAYNIVLNEWNNTATVQLQLVDLRDNLDY